MALIEAGSPGLHIYSHVAMGRGLPLLATVVRDAGWETRAYIEDIGGRDCVDWDFVRDASVIGFSAITCTMPRTAELLAQARSVNPSAVVLFGGPEPTCHPARSFDAGADMVLRGESELTLPRLLAVLAGESQESLGDIEGLMWREEGLVREGAPMRQLTAKELNALPLVDHSLTHASESRTCATVWRTRGCPSHCDFCEVCEIYPRCVHRSDEPAIAELMDGQRLGYRTAFLIDDNAAANKPGFMEFLRKVGENGYARVLVTQLRADSVFGRDGKIDHEFLRLLKHAAGVTVACVGVESAADENLEAVHKNVDSKRMARALKAMRRAGILVHGMFIAFNDDARDTIRRNGEYARKYVNSLQYLFETPLPGTKRTREHESSGNILFAEPDDLLLYDGMHCVLRPMKMPAEEMQRLVESEDKRFYSLRRIVVSVLDGLFVRFRRLNAGQRKLLRQLSPARRIRTWLLFHAEYKFAPAANLVVGRKRLRDLRKDPKHEAFLQRLSALRTPEAS